MEIFHFKKFEILQNAASVFKVNTEAVLLSAWVKLEPTIEILEIGSGTGVISLGLKQRIDNSSHITAIDIDKNAFELTIENINLNQATNICAQNISFQNYSKLYPSKHFDLIISNPPYFDYKWKSVKPRNILSKYTDALDYSTLIELAIKHLKSNGKIAIVIPYHDFNKIQEILNTNSAYIQRALYMKTVINKPPLRVFLEISKRSNPCEIQLEEIYIKDLKNKFSEEYKNLTKEYYTIF